MIVLVAPALLMAANVHGSSAYTADVEKWRQTRESKLKAEDGWLSLAGLFWLKEGNNPVGSDPSSTVALPNGKAPAKVGTIVMKAGKAHLNVLPGATVLVNGKQTSSADLKIEDSGVEPDVVTVGTLKFYVIHRDTRNAVRLKDKDSEYRRGFTGLKWYPVKDTWRIEAKWVPYNPPKKVAFDTMVGGKDEEDIPGYAAFTVAGKEYRLEPSVEDNELFFVFRDKTAGKTTYPAARFLKSEMPKDGKVLLDFNKAYNPPCVFTPYATCPLPPAQNRLPFELDAGELMYKSAAYAAKH
jgi:uncharacterized protein (DUF1684 family)